MRYFNSQVVTRIEVISKVFDARAGTKLKQLQNSHLIPKNSSLKLLDVYTIQKQFSDKELEKIGSMLSNPVTQEYTIKVANSSKLNSAKFSYAFEVGFLPGVTDNLASTAREEIEDLLKVKFTQEEGIYSSQLLLIDAPISKKDAEKLASSLINPLIQRVHIKSYDQYQTDKGMDFITPAVHISGSSNVSEIDFHVSDLKLSELGKLGIENPDGTRRGPLALDLLYMKAIQEYFKKKKRNPTDIELESIAQTWSEHCKHTIFADPIDDVKKGLFKTYIKRATEKIREKKGKKDICVSVFTDNSGAIEFDQGYLVTHKAETHNTPSALDPFGGAITGIVGVNRDALGFGLGAKPVINLYGYCFADPTTTRTLYRDKGLKNPMLSPRRIMDGVIAGVNTGGNCSGIPTPQGFVYFDSRYQGKPLVFVGTVGLIPKKLNKKKSYVKKALPGDYIVMVGGRVGLDGIHGATFSSEELNSGSPSTAVQIGDPITQKKFSDAIVKEARDMELYNSITDNGAGGLSCSVAEMAKESNGCEVDLEKVPLKYPGLEPWQIWISESQERMTLSISSKKWGEFSDLMKRRGVEATIIGKFTNSGKCVVRYGGKKIMDIDLTFLHDGLPKRPLKTKKVVRKLTEPKSMLGVEKTMYELLKRPNLSSFEFISTQYDHIVQGSAVLYPLQGKGRINSDTSITRPLLSSEKGVVLSQALYPTYSDIDTYHMAASSIDTALRNVITAGANPDKIALLDNFCWCSSNEPERLYELKEAARACYEYALSYEAPYISGKDSMFNDFKGYDEKGKEIKISVPPTLLISSIGIIDDISKAVSLDAKSEGDLLYILGETNDELGGSEVYNSMGVVGKNIPLVDAKRNMKLYRKYYEAVNEGLITAGVSIHRGGLSYSLLRMLMGGKFGADVTLRGIKGNANTDFKVLFSESQGRILVSINPSKKKKFEKLFASSLSYLGDVTSKKDIVLEGTKKETYTINVEKALENYRSTFKGY